MKKNILAMLLLVFGAMTLFAQDGEVRNVASFTAIDLEGNADIYLIKADSQSVEIETRNPWHADRIKTKVRNNTLCVYYEDDWFHDRGRMLNPFPRYRIYITYTSLEELELEGRIRIQTDTPLEADELEIELSGYITGEMTIFAQKLELDTEGYVKIRLDGETDSQEICMEGMGHLDAKDLLSNVCEVEIDGSTTIDLFVREELDAEVGGVSTMNYQGNPAKKKIDRDGWVRVRSYGD